MSMTSKNVFKIATFALIASLALNTFAQDNNQLVDYPTVRAALNQDALVLNAYNTCLQDGHKLSEIKVDPVYYFAQPVGPHLAFTVTVVMNKKVGGNFSLETEYVHMVIHVYGDGEGNLSAKEINIKRSTVY